MPSFPTVCPNCGREVSPTSPPRRTCAFCHTALDTSSETDPPSNFFTRPFGALLAVFAVVLVLAGGIVGVVMWMQPAKDAPFQTDGPLAHSDGIPDTRGANPAEPDPTPIAPLPAGIDTRIPEPKLPPKVPYKRYAVSPLPITPAPLPKDIHEVTLPGTASEWFIGGGGRFLILHVPSKRQLAVLDVSAGKITKLLPLAAEAVHFAAGMNQLFVGYPDAGVLVRYGLPTLEKEAILPLKVPGRVTGLSMGHASAGPLLVAFASDMPFKDNHFGGGGAFLLDPFTLARYDEPGFDVPEPRVGPGLEGTHQLGPDGTVLVSSGRFNGSVRFLGTGGPKFLPRDPFEERGGHVLPGPDGTFHTANGRLNSAGKPLDGGGQTFRAPTVPAAHGSLYLQIEYRAKPQMNFNQPPEPAKNTVDVRAPDLSVPLASYPLPPATRLDAQLDIRAEPHRYLFVPDAKALAIVAPGNEKVFLYKFDLVESAKNLPEGTVFVSSRPGPVTPGAAFEYAIVAHTKNGGLTYKLDTGPKGMALAADGKMTWTVPNDFTGPEPVIVTVTDGNGKQALHSFDLTAATKLPAAPPAVTPTLPLVAEPPTPFVGPSVIRLPAQPFDQPATPPGSKTLPLPGEADATCLGGGGRFLLLRLPKLSQLAVLDLALGKVVKYLPMPAANAPFAAGMNSAFVYDKTANAFQRWSLTTLEKDGAVPNTTGRSPTALLMGYAVDGPLTVIRTKVVGERAGVLVDPLTGREFPLQETNHGDIGLKQWSAREGPAVSGDGRVYTSARAGLDSYVLRGSVGQPYSNWGVESGANAKPGPDGLIGSNNGILTPNQFRLSPGFHRLSPASPHIPATDGGLFLRVVFPPPDYSRPPKPVPTKLLLTLVGENEVQLPIPLPAEFDLKRPQSHPGDGVKRLTFTERLVLNPVLGVLAGVSAAGDSVTLVSVRPKELLSAARPDRLLVLSRPPMADAGKPWTYTPDVWSPSGKSTVALVSGPAGLTVAGGTATWTPPADYPAAEVNVVLSVTDGADRETFHAFTLPVRNGGNTAPKGTPNSPSSPLNLTPPPVEPIEPKPPVVPPKPPVVPPSPKLPKWVLAPVKPVPITPATIPDKGRSVKLPGEIQASCVGGGGRYLFLHMTARKEIAVFDMCLAKVVKSLPLADGEVKFAAGMNKLVVLYTSTGIATRYDFGTWEKEATRKVRIEGNISAMAMGSASSGPLVIHSMAVEQFGRQPPVAFFDPLTLTQVEPPAGATLPAAGSPVLLRCSPDGRVIALSVANSNPGRPRLPTAVIVLRGDKADAVPLPQGTEPVTPGPDETLYGIGRTFSLAGKPTAAANVALKPGPPTANRLISGRAGLPAESGSLFVNVEMNYPAGPLGNPDQLWPLTVQVLAPGARLLVSYADLPGIVAKRVGADHGRVFVLVPDAKAFAFVGNDTIHLRPFAPDGK